MDVARGLSVDLMIVEHVIMYFTSNTLLHIPLFKIIQNGIADVAVIFMFLMGMNTVFPNRTTPRKILTRGCTILLVNYIFNFFRDFLPACIGCSLLVTKLSDFGYTKLFGLGQEQKLCVKADFYYRFTTLIMTNTMSKLGLKFN